LPLNRFSTRKKRFNRHSGVITSSFVCFLPVFRQNGGKWAENIQIKWRVAPEFPDLCQLKPDAGKKKVAVIQTFPRIIQNVFPTAWLTFTSNPTYHNPARGPMRHLERHRTHRIGWLRAAVLGANDGIVSTASLILGVAAAGAGSQGILVAGAAGLVAGAMSMAAGEYVSVSSQADTERADLDLERRELAQSPKFEHDELADIYVKRGLDPELASTVATQLMEYDALGAHARDELGISASVVARPVQAALASAATFSVGAALPLLVVILLPPASLMWAVSGSALAFLALLGSLAAKAGGAPVMTAALRVTFWGGLAMALTAGVGALFGITL